MTTQKQNVYVIHGWTYSLDKWEKLEKQLKKKGIKLNFLKVPGLTTESKEVWDINNYVDWLRNEIGHEVDPVIIGHSNGGRITLAYAQAYPDHLGQIILIDSAGIEYTDKATVTKRAIYKFLAKAGKKVTKSDKARKLLHKSARASDYYSADDNMKKTMQNMLDADKDLNIEAIGQRTTIIWGDKDTVTPVYHAEELDRRLQYSELHFIEGAKHSPHFTHTSKVASIIERAIN